MKSIDELLQLLDREKAYLKEKYNIRSISIFGSYSRKKQKPDSDVDILVDFEQPIGIEFVDLAEELEGILGEKVDLVSRKGIKADYYKEIEQDLVNVQKESSVINK